PKDKRAIQSWRSANPFRRFLSDRNEFAIRPFEKDMLEQVVAVAIEVSGTKSDPGNLHWHIAGIFPADEDLILALGRGDGNRQVGDLLAPLELVIGLARTEFQKLQG